MSGAGADALVEHSRAFESLVQDEDDLVGLLAYATYKQSVREAAIAGQPVPAPAARDLQPALVNALRSSAEQVLTRIVDNGIRQATPDIQSTTTLAALAGNHTETLAALQTERQRVEAHVTARTAFLPAFLTNLVAWALTLVIAVAVLFLADRPSMETTISRSIGGTKTQATGGPPPSLGDEKAKGDVNAAGR